jgi:hypothetical protein
MVSQSDDATINDFVSVGGLSPGAVRYYHSNGKVVDGAGLFGLHKALYVNVKAQAKWEGGLEFLDSRLGARFGLMVRAELRPVAKRGAHQVLVNLHLGAGSLHVGLMEALKQELTTWGRQRPAGFLQAILDNRGPDGSQPQLTDVVLGIFERHGLDCDHVKVNLQPFIKRPNWEIRQPNLQVRLSDLNRTIHVDLTCTLQHDPTSPHYYTNTTQLSGAAGDVPSVEQCIVDAICRSLEGSRLQDWSATSPDLRKTAFAAASAEAARFGWRLGGTFILFSAEAEAKRQEAKNFSFAHVYKLPGLNRSIKIEHTGSYEMGDPARYEMRHRSGQDIALDFRDFIEKQVQRLTERQLQVSSYADAIALLHDNNKLESAVSEELGSLLAEYGYKAGSCHVVINALPEAPLLRQAGHAVELFDDESFRLAIPERRAILGVTAKLRLVDAQRLQPWLDHDASDAKPIEKLVADKTRSIISAFLNNIKPDEYRLSDLTYGPRLIDGDVYIEHYDVSDDANVQLVFRALQGELIPRIATAVLDDYGIEISDIQFLRGEDAVSRRVEELRGRTIEIAGSAVLRSVETGVDETVRVNLECVIFQTAPQYEHRFAIFALHHKTVDAHVAVLQNSLQRALSHLLEAYRCEHLTGEYRGPVIGAIARALTASIQSVYGLNVRIDPGTSAIELPATIAAVAAKRLNESKKAWLDNVTALLEKPATGDLDDVAEEVIEKERAKLAIIGEIARDPQFQHRAVNGEVRAAFPPAVEIFSSRVGQMRLPKDIANGITGELKLLAAPRPDASKSGQDADEND